MTYEAIYNYNSWNKLFKRKFYDHQTFFFLPNTWRLKEYQSIVFFLLNLLHFVLISIIFFKFSFKLEKFMQTQSTDAISSRLKSCSPARDCEMPPVWSVGRAVKHTEMRLEGAGVAHCHPSFFTDWPHITLQPATVTPANTVCVCSMCPRSRLTTSWFCFCWPIKGVKFNKSFRDLQNTGYVCNYTMSLNS